jgi:hypothetical protein
MTTDEPSIAKCVAKTPKAFFWKQETPKKGHVRGTRPPKTVPKTGKAFFWKQETPKKGHVRGTRPPKTVPKTGKAFFWKQETPKKGHVREQSRPFGTDPPQTGFKGGACPLTMYALVKMAQKKFRNLPSDARFCAKRFRHIDFWTFFLSIF